MYSQQFHINKIIVTFLIFLFDIFRIFSSMSSIEGTLSTEYGKGLKRSLAV